MIDTHSELEKSFSLKTGEFISALLILRDSIQATKDGRIYFVSVLAGQLRALLIDKANHSEPRFLQAANQLGFDLKVYCMPDTSSFPLPDELKKDLIFRLAGLPVTLEQQLDTQEQVSFIEFINKKIVYYKGTSYTTRTIIEWFANRNGGAHYSKYIPRHFAEMLNFIKIDGISTVHQVILQLSAATVELGADMLKKLINQDLHVSVLIPTPPTESAVLIDAHHAQSGMRLTISVTRIGKILCQMRGMHHTCIDLVSTYKIEFAKPHHITIRITITQNLSTQLFIIVDGKEIGVATLDVPIYVIFDLRELDFYQNRAFDADPQDFSFAIGDIASFRINSSIVDSAKLLLYFDERIRNSEETMLLFEKKSYGHAPSGTTDICMTGSVRSLAMADVLELAADGCKSQSTLDEAKTVDDCNTSDSPP